MERRACPGGNCETEGPMDGTTMYDALVIGAGVSGCSIARELSRLDGRFLVLEAEVLPSLIPQNTT